MRVAQIGLGRIGFFLEEDPLRYKPCTHLGALLALKKQEKALQITGLCDTNNEKIQTVKKKLSELVIISEKINFTSDYKKVFEENPEFLIIATTTHSHHDILSYALRQSVPKILIEKPLVMNKQDLKNVIKLYSKSSSRVWVNYERRYHEKYIQLKDELRNHEKIISYRGLIICPEKPFYPHQKDEGLLLHDTTHLLDLIIFLFGVPKAHTVGEYTHNYKTHHLVLEHTDQSLRGELMSICHPKVFHFELEILTKNERIVIGNGYKKVEKIKSSENYSQFYSFDMKDSIKVKTDKKPSFERNPFIKLYREIIFEKESQDNFKDSSTNIDILINTF